MYVLYFFVQGSACSRHGWEDVFCLRTQEAYESMASLKQRIWIVKPAEWANRGCGIRP